MENNIPIFNRNELESILKEHLGNAYTKSLVIEVSEISMIDVFIQVNTDIIYEDTDNYNLLSNYLENLGYKDVRISSGKNVKLEVGKPC